MRIFLYAFPLVALIISCNNSSSIKHEEGWQRAYVEPDDGSSAEAAMAHTIDGDIDSLKFSSGKTIGNFLGLTIFPHSQNIQLRNSDISYTVYLIPDEWDQTKELFQHKEEDNPDYR